MLKVHEHTARNGELVSVHLRLQGDGLALIDGEAELPVPAGALPAVMSRYGAPFDAQARSHRVGCLELGAGAVLHHVRHLAGYDVIARDYLVLEAPGREPLCVMATTVVGALRHLAIAAQRREARAST